MYSLISTFFLLLLALSSVQAAVGPIRPDRHPDTALEEAVRKMRLTIDQEKLYLARLMEDKSLLIRQSAAETEADEDDGFTETVNDGFEVFEPILPGASVPPADEFGPTDEPEISPDDSPVPSPAVSFEPTPIPVFTPEPSTGVSPIETPEVTPITTPSFFPLVSTEPTPEFVPENTPDPVLDPTPSVTPDEVPVGSPEISPESPESVDNESNEEEGEDDGVCFPATAKVQLEDGSIIAMEDIKLGDRVKVGHNQYSEVFMFTHKLANVRYSFLKIDTASGESLTLTKSHYLYVNGLPAAASTVKVGDTLEMADKSISQVVKIDRVYSRGLFNPQTTHGDIIVDNVRATTYTTTVDRGVAHALLAPLRAAYCTAGWSMTALDAGSKILASLVPSGSLI